METSFAAAAVLLFLVVDPLGNIPLFSGILNRYSIRKRRRIIVRETIISFAVLLVFMLMGKRFLQIMHLTEWALQIGGAVVLFLIAIRMIFPHPEGIMGVASSDQEPFIVPLSIPGMAGPSSMATVMLLAAQAPNRLGQMVGALSVVMAATGVILYFADVVQRRLGDRFTVAMERLMGMILVAVSVQMLLTGVNAYWQSLR